MTRGVFAVSQTSYDAAMTALQLEVFEAFTEANVSPTKARALAAAIDRAIDDRYRHHADALATQGDLKALGADLRGDIAVLRTELRTGLSSLETKIEARFSDQLKWLLGVQVALAGLIVAALKLWH